MRKKINYKPSKQQAGISFAVGLIFTFLGIGMVIPMTLSSGFPFMGLFGLAWTGIAVYQTVLSGKYLFGKSGGKNENLFGGYEVTEEPSLPEELNHEHIKASGLSPQKRLEQLETLKEAGLITEEEYRDKRKDILRGL